MRRKEFSVQEQQEIEDFLRSMSFGFLGTSGEDGYPHITPLNYTYQNGHIYFHGSKAGSKMKELVKSHKVSFAVAKEFAVIPSYFSDPRQACPATAFFKSVHIRGIAEPVDDLHEKAEALSGLMEKLQPEGGYAPITPDDPLYTGELKAVSVVRITVEDLTAKFKFGQNLKEDRLAQVMEGLEERGLAGDPETVEMMKRYCPFHNKDADRL
ncbi:pyridoxamine 5'-phosphate oxidase family protein [Paenibacillus filicis]|uniref:Pyridoxamine 5'-phosphate oxidase family protein n=1 Tax=Paenibacillus gyeongsangnamensis TaxID=3388067 RepID=A0ABT4QK00_9BACL|nr:pyridoxamine 5'-phosphate oxidase family protein [Paenibacillus filicis]MCZ8517117.1 pyridoxamine 5'-phosphate oxidase family protein [Paenibacillus filicis]